MKRLAKSLLIAKIKAREKVRPHSWSSGKAGPWDGRSRKADGGGVEEKPAFDPSQPFQAAASDKPAFDPSKPFEVAPEKSPAPSWSDAITDIPHEIASEAGNAVDKIKALGNRGEQGPLEGLMTTGKAALAVPQLIASPLTGAARSLIGHPMAQAEHAVGTLINPEQAAKDDPAKMYEAAKSDVDTAMSAMGGEKPSGLIAAKPAKLNVVAPSTKELFQAADSNYKNARGLGVEIHPQAVANVADNILTDLHTDGFRDYLAPKTYRAIDELKNPPGQNVEIADLEGVRRALGKAAADPAEKAAATRGIGAIDDYLANLDPKDVVVNPQFAGKVSAEAQEARGNYAAAKRSEQLDAVEKKADRQANSAGSGTNIDNATRQKIKEVLNNPKKLRGFSDSEVDQMEKIIRGTPVGNVARLLGKFAPSGVVSGALSAGAGFAAHGPLGAVALPAAGYAAKKAADASTLRLLAKLKNDVRARSPLGKQKAINAAAQSVFAQPSKPLLLPGATQAAAQIQAPYRGMNLGPLQGAVPARAQDEQQ